MIKRLEVNFDKMIVPAGTTVSLKDHPTRYAGIEISKAQGKEILESELKDFAEMQDKLFAHNRYSLLIILQAMDTAGKDGIIRHVMSGLNPAGVKVYYFKAPTPHELDHDYFWRHYLTLPARGEIGIFNRSYYENVIVTKVHPGLILNEHLPGIQKIEDIDDKFWERRYRQIRRFEKNLFQNGTLILKFFLHLSKEEQKKQLLERIDDPHKNWKFSVGDLKERGFWDDYQRCYEQMISATSTEFAPWAIIPADDKWFSRIAVGTILYRYFGRLELKYPEVNADQLAALQEARQQLLNESE